MAAEFQQQLGASYTATISIGLSGGIIIGSLDAQVSGALQVYGSQTTTKSIGVAITIPPRKSAVVYAGSKFVNGKYKYYECNKSGRLYVRQAGKAWSYKVLTLGGVQCGKKKPKHALAKLAKKRYC
jgi:hypothetical protein